MDSPLTSLERGGPSIPVSDGLSANATARPASEELVASVSVKGKHAAKPNKKAKKKMVSLSDSSSCGEEYSCSSSSSDEDDYLPFSLNRDKRKRDLKKKNMPKTGEKRKRKERPKMTPEERSKRSRAARHNRVQKMKQSPVIDADGKPQKYLIDPKGGMPLSAVKDLVWEAGIHVPNLRSYTSRSTLVRLLIMDAQSKAAEATGAPSYYMQQTGTQVVVANVLMADFFFCSAADGGGLSLRCLGLLAGVNKQIRRFVLHSDSALKHACHGMQTAISKICGGDIVPFLAVQQNIAQLLSIPLRRLLAPESLWNCFAARVSYMTIAMQIPQFPQNHPSRLGAYSAELSEWGSFGIGSSIPFTRKVGTTAPISHTFMPDAMEMKKRMTRWRAPYTVEEMNEVGEKGISPEMEAKKQKTSFTKEQQEAVTTSVPYRLFDLLLPPGTPYHLPVLPDGCCLHPKTIDVVSLEKFKFSTREDFIAMACMLPEFAEDAGLPQVARLRGTLDDHYYTAPFGALRQNQVGGNPQYPAPVAHDHRKTSVMASDPERSCIKDILSNYFPVSYKRMCAGGDNSRTPLGNENDIQRSMAMSSINPRALPMAVYHMYFGGVRTTEVRAETVAEDGSKTTELVKRPEARVFMLVEEGSDRAYVSPLGPSVKAGTLELCRSRRYASGCGLRWSMFDTGHSTKGPAFFRVAIMQRFRVHSAVMWTLYKSFVKKKFDNFDGLLHRRAFCALNKHLYTLQEKIGDVVEKRCSREAECKSCNIGVDSSRASYGFKTVLNETPFSNMGNIHNNSSYNSSIGEAAAHFEFARTCFRSLFNSDHHSYQDYLKNANLRNGFDITECESDKEERLKKQTQVQSDSVVATASIAMNNNTAVGSNTRSLPGGQMGTTVKVKGKKRELITDSTTPDAPMRYINDIKSVTTQAFDELVEKGQAVVFAIVDSYHCEFPQWSKFRTSDMQIRYNWGPGDAIPDYVRMPGKYNALSMYMGPDLVKLGEDMFDSATVAVSGMRAAAEHHGRVELTSELEYIARARNRFEKGQRDFARVQAMSLAGER